MFILAINASHRPDKTTTQLTRAALEGAASQGADTEMVLLVEKDIGFCTNCLTCYKDLESDIGPCILQDDMRPILESIKAADGVLLSSPVHSGFITGRMVAFMERATWTLCTPTGDILGLKGCPTPRLTDKPRASASLLSAGGIPTELRQYCDLGTPWLRDIASLLFNGEFVADMYAGASYPKPVKNEEWPHAYLLREIMDSQIEEAFELGKTLAKAAAAGVRPYDPSMSLPPQA